MQVLQASKWQKIQVLLDVEELTSLLEELGEVCFGIVSEAVPIERAFVSKQQFIEEYAKYIEGLKEGQLFHSPLLRAYLSSVLVKDRGALFTKEVGKGRVLLRVCQPVIQLQAHHFFYSTLDQAFHSMVLSQESITWGLQFSYPQWVQDPVSLQIQKVRENPAFTHTELFFKLLRWMREHTLPTPFLVEGRRVNAPMRIGKRSLSWISAHPQLKEKKLAVSR